MKKFLTGAVALVAVFPAVAFAQLSDFDTLLAQLVTWINAIIPFLLLLATLYFFWGLTQFILKAGDEEARAKAKDIMIWGVVAVFVMVSFWGLVGFLSSTFNPSSAAQVQVAPAIPNFVPGAF